MNRDYDRYLIYDIETFENDRLEEYIAQKNIVPDARLKDPDKIAADIEKKKQAMRDKAGLDPRSGRVTCIGASYNGNFAFFIDRDEATLLNDFNEYVAGKEVTHFAGKNNWDFDLPFLRVRHLANKIALPPWLAGTCRHIDIKNYFGKGMGQRGPSMKDLEWVMGIKREGEKDALQALEWWKEGRWDLLEIYNEQDVRTTEHLFLALSGYYH